jgi:hypothetical protein
MPQVDAPITGGKIDTNDPSGSFVSIGKAIAGVGLAVLVVSFGQRLGDVMTRTTDSALGTNVSGSGIQFRGEL